MTEPFKPNSQQEQLLRDMKSYPEDFEKKYLRNLDRSTLRDLQILMFHEIIPPLYVHDPVVCTTEDLVTSSIPLDSTQEQRDDFAAFMKLSDEYFSLFVKPTLNERNERVCHFCGDPLLGLMAALTGKGGFRWGLAHGEGECSCCGWPMRAHHEPRDPKDNGILFSLRSTPLAYMPDTFSARAAREAAANAASPAPTPNEPSGAP